MTSNHATLVSRLPTRDDSSSTSGLVRGQSAGGSNNCYSDYGFATDSPYPSVMTEQFNARSANNGCGTPLTSSRLLNVMKGHGQIIREEAVETQLEPEESPSCSIRTERTGRKDENEKGRTNNVTTDIDANETFDEIEMSQRRVDEVYGGTVPPPLPSTSSSREKNLEEYLSQFRQLSTSERRKLLGRVKTILDVGDKSMVSVFDGRGMSDTLHRNNNQDDDDEDDSLLASSSEEDTAMDSRASSCYSDNSTAFYTTDVSTAFFTADTRTSMYSTADTYNTSDVDCRARFARRYRKGGRGGGGGKRQGGKTATRAVSRGRRTRNSRSYPDINCEDGDDDDEEMFLAMMNFPCISYLLCDFNHEIMEEGNVPEQVVEPKAKDKDVDDEKESWDWNNNGKTQKRTGQVETSNRPVKTPGKGDNNKESYDISDDQMDGKCSPSFSLTSHGGMTVKERMEKLEEKLFGKPFEYEEPTTAATIMEKLSTADEITEVSALKKTAETNISDGDNEHKVEQHENDNTSNDCGVVTMDVISGEKTNGIVDDAAKDMESKLSFNLVESESDGIEANTIDTPKDTVPLKEIQKTATNDDPILEMINDEAAAKSIPRNRSESPFIKVMTTLSRKSSRSGTPVDGAKLGSGDNFVTRQRSVSPFLKAIPTRSRSAARLNEVKPVDESLLPAKASEQAGGTTCCNKSNATEVSDDSAEMPGREDQNGGTSVARLETPGVESMKTVTSMQLVERQQQIPESPIELVQLVHQKPPRAQKKRFKLSLFTRKKKTSVGKTFESPTRNKQSEPSMPTSPEVTVRSIESSDSPTTPITTTQFEYQEKTELADVMYVALKDSPVSASTTSSAKPMKKRRGWKEYTDLATGDKYYSDGVTTTWIKPVNFSRDSSPVTALSRNDANVESHERGAKKGWREYIDRTTGKPYYSDGKTTSWTKPVDLKR